MVNCSFCFSPRCNSRGFFYARNSAPTQLLIIPILLGNVLHLPNNIHLISRSAAQTGFLAAFAGMMCRTTFYHPGSVDHGEILLQNFNK